MQTVGNWNIVDNKGSAWLVQCLACQRKTAFPRSLLSGPYPPRCKCGGKVPSVPVEASKPASPAVVPVQVVAPVSEPIAVLVKHKLRVDRPPLTQRLTVLGPAPKTGKHNRVYAKCVCGTVKTYELTKIKTGNTKSCGCAKREALQAIMPLTRKVKAALPGMVYTWLTVLREAAPYVYQGKSERRVVCGCLCGSEQTYRVRSLTHGESKSCGCIRRKGARGRWMRL